MLLNGSPTCIVGGMPARLRNFRLEDRRRFLRPSALPAVACLGVALVGLHCNGSDGGGDPCKEQIGVIGGSEVVDLTVSDTAFAVGGPDSGSMQPIITIENMSTVTLTLFNVGTRPHDLVMQCLENPNTMGCPTQYCFPPGANLPPVQPGASATTTFVAPFKEGPYMFTSDVDGDTDGGLDGSVSGLVGQYVLM